MHKGGGDWGGGRVKLSEIKSLRGCKHIFVKLQKMCLPFSKYLVTGLNRYIQCGLDIDIDIQYMLGMDEYIQ